MAPLSAGEWEVLPLPRSLTLRFLYVARAARLVYFRCFHLRGASIGHEQMDSGPTKR